MNQNEHFLDVAGWSSIKDILSDSIGPIFSVVDLKKKTKYTVLIYG